MIASLVVWFFGLGLASIGLTMALTFVVDKTLFHRFDTVAELKAGNVAVALYLGFTTLTNGLISAMVVMAMIGFVPGGGQ